MSLLIHKVVQPGKVIHSRSADKICRNQRLIVEAQAEMGTAHTTVLWKADTAVRRKLGGLDLPDRRFNEPTKFQPLFLRDGGPQILDLGLVLPYEDD